MKFTVSILALCGLIAFAFAAPLDDSANAQILRYDNENIADGYKFGYETSDGVTRQEEAELKNVGTEQEAIVIRGSVSWVAPDGQTYTLNYIADENGFQPIGDHLPHV
ncbi:flexible cuticle protein 12 [Ceratitis capitata]|uniref:(Mediterranean fruit fly) hypothetical protein n=1 Tax=Ceratitis capitata TaxID=7213 RepID=W8BY71_CERCA|nr:flexible cuticle protein 12 [Ceratitis capitata]CAD7004131.1 unnamed protein product [Ceratitis capitata]